MKSALLTGDGIMIHIGYQGEVGSNSEAVAEIFTKEQNLKQGNYELIPLVESGKVVHALKSGRIDYGVLAIRNSEAGIAKETEEAMRGENFKCIKTIVLPIHHCIFIISNVEEKDITLVISHIQALDQTRKSRRLRFPDWTEFAVIASIPESKSLR